MRIACVGWGSLVWDQRELPIRGDCWFDDGPMLRVEFARLSERNRRITLVIVRPKEIHDNKRTLGEFPFVRSLWGLMDVADVEQAKEALRVREDMTSTKRIGVWPQPKGANHRGAKEVGGWAKRLQLDAAVWTALPPKYPLPDDRAPPIELAKRKNGQIPSHDQVVAHLRSLGGADWDSALEYFQKTPKAVDTPCRRWVQQKLYPRPT